MVSANVNRINLHVSNIEMCNAMLDAITTFIENLMENLDDVSKYSLAMDLLNSLDDLVQTCYDCADDSSQAVIDYLEEVNWDYSHLEGYRKYSRMLSTYLKDTNDVEIYREDEEDKEDEEGEDVTDEFDIKLTGMPSLTYAAHKTAPDTSVKGQLHFPNDYTDEESLAKGKIKPSVSDPVEERKKARAAYLAAIKQKNTSQPT